MSLIVTKQDIKRNIRVTINVNITFKPSTTLTTQVQTCQNTIIDFVSIYLRGNKTNKIISLCL